MIDEKFDKGEILGRGVKRTGRSNEKGHSSSRYRHTPTDNDMFPGSRAKVTSKYQKDKIREILNTKAPTQIKKPK